MKKTTRAQLTLEEMPEVLIGAGAGVFGVVVAEQIIGDGPVSRTESRQHEGQTSANKEIAPYDTGIEIGGFMVLGVLAAVAISRRFKKSH